VLAAESSVMKKISAGGKILVKLTSSRFVHQKGVSRFISAMKEDEMNSSRRLSSSKGKAAEIVNGQILCEEELRLHK
jgi:hypothetical protein